MNILNFVYSAIDAISGGALTGIGINLAGIGHEAARTASLFGWA